MNSGIASYITSAGLRAVTSAGSLGPYFAIKYFLPIYDYRIDKTICREISGTTAAVSISSLNLVSATHETLYGEKIYPNATYQVSNRNYLYWKSSMGSLPDGINNSVLSQQSVTTDVNLLGGKPLSVVVSGSKFVSPTTGSFNVSGTHVVSGAELSTFNPMSGSTWPTSAFYRVAGYSPNANGLTSATGSFKCRIPPSDSSFKFNGLALYAVKVDGNGFDDYGNGTTFGFNPTLFSVVLFDQAQYKQNDVGGVNDFEFSVDLSFDWNTASGGTTNIPRYIETNYWVKVPTATSTSAYALNYDGDAVLSNSAVAGSYSPRAKLTIVDPSKQQLRLANDNERFTDFRTIRFANNLVGPVPDITNRVVLSIDTSCPDDALLQLGYKTSAVGIKSVAIGCYSSAFGYTEGVISDFGDNTPVDINSITNTTGGYTVAIGVQNYAEGFGSIALGYLTSAIGYLNFAGGEASISKYGYFDPSADKKDGLNFAYGKEVSAISRTSLGPYFDYGTDRTILADDESYGSNIAFGVRSLSNGGLSFVNGAYVSAYGVNSFGLGYKNLAKGHFSFVAGINSSAMSDMCFSYGNNVDVRSPNSFGYGKNLVVGYDNYASSFNLCIGEYLSAYNPHSIALGSFAIATGINSLAIGQNFGGVVLGDSKLSDGKTHATGINSLAIGCMTSALGKNSISIGYNNLSLGDAAVAIGSGNLSTSYGSVAIGVNTVAAGMFSLAGNNETSAIGGGSVALGYRSVSQGIYSLALGYMSSAVGIGSLAGGIMSSANGAYSLAYGVNSKTDGEGSIALGYEAKALHDKSVAIGNNAETTGPNQIVIGSCEDTVLIKGSRIDIGCGSNVNIPGISQFNDSISVDINFTGPQANNISLAKRTLSVEIGRSGFSKKTIKLEETGYNSCIFTITEMSGIIYAWVYSNASAKLNKLELGSRLNMHGLSYFTLTNANIVVAFDKILNAPIFLCSSIDSPQTLTSIDYLNYSDLPNLVIFKSLCDSSFTADTHNCYWLPNINYYNVYVNYDKVNLPGILILHTNKNIGDGICYYRLFNRVVGEASSTTVIGQDWQDWPTDPYASAIGSGGNNSELAGSFINSNGKSIVSNTHKWPIDR